MLRIMIVDNCELVRVGIRTMLKEIDDIEVVGEAATGEDTLLQIRDLRPDIIIMDVNMPGIGGLETALRILRGQHAAKILIISTHTHGILPKRLLELGVAGYLTKQASQAELLEAIRAICSGDRYIDNRVDLEKEVHNGVSSAIFATLSERELQILLMIARGMGTREIAEKLYLSVKTINSHRRSILKKLEVKTDIGLVCIAIRWGLVDPNSQWH